MMVITAAAAARTTSHGCNDSVHNAGMRWFLVIIGPLKGALARTMRLVVICVVGGGGAVVLGLEALGRLAALACAPSSDPGRVEKLERQFI